MKINITTIVSNKYVKWIPALIIILVSWILSCKSKLTSIPTFRNADKLVHLICFSGLSFWVSFACNIKNKTQLWKPVLIVSFYGFIDEIHQCFTPGRSCSFFDWCADFTGAIIGGLVFLYVLNKIVYFVRIKA